MGFKSLDEVYQDYLELPGPGGKKYRIPECDFETGLWCTRAFVAANMVANGHEAPPDAPQLVLDDDDELSLQRRLLGEELLAELRADGAGKPKIDFFTTTAFFWHAAGRDTAEAYWNAGGRAEDFSPAANRAARRLQARSTSTGAANTTRPRGSTSGTKSQRTSAKA